MNAMDRLREDHRHLSSKIAVLESALEMGPGAWFAVRETCYSVSKHLRQHTRREARLVAACHRELGRVGAKELDRLAIEHHDASKRLQSLTGLLWGEPCFSLSGIAPSLTSATAALRHQINEQEAKLFPLLDLVFSLQGVFGKDNVLTPSRLAGTIGGIMVKRT